jgi:hypothetical protein
LLLVMLLEKWNADRLRIVYSGSSTTNSNHDSKILSLRVA